MKKLSVFQLIFAVFAALSTAHGQTITAENEEEIMIDVTEFFEPETAKGSTGVNTSFNERFEKISQLNISLEEIEITIYNKWGEVMYTGNLSEAGWDGKYDDKRCPEDFYYWSMKWKKDPAIDATTLHRFWLLR